MKMSAHKPIVRLFLTLIFSLMLAFPFVPSVSAWEVLGEATSFTESQMNLLVAKPAVVQIANIVSGEVILQSVVAAQLGAPALAGRSYAFNVGMGGSGFFVTSDGYLITNGHVANPDDDLIAYYGIAYTTETIFKDAVKVLLETYYEYSPTDAELEAAFEQELLDSYGGDIWNLIDEFYLGYKAGELAVNSVKKNNYIQTGAVSGSEKVVKDLGKAAVLIDSPYEGDSDSRDLALLKVDGSNFPTIELGSFENVQVGTEVYAMGYPAIVEEYTGVFTDVESGLEPSVTKGIVSAKKKLVDGTEAFQTDAGITHGNSGGPVVDLNGEVIGVATWGFGDEPGGENFNFLISVENVENLLARNNVTASKSVTTEKWENALSQYSRKCYTDAKQAFEETKNLYADNVDIEDFISKCQAAIEAGEDECISLIKPWMYIALAACCGLGVVGVLVVIVFVVVRKKKKAKS